MVWFTGFVRYRMAADYRSHRFRDFIDMRYGFGEFRPVVGVGSIHGGVLCLQADA